MNVSYGLLSEYQPPTLVSFSPYFNSISGLLSLGILSAFCKWEFPEGEQLLDSVVKEQNFGEPRFIGVGRWREWGFFFSSWVNAPFLVCACSGLWV